MSGGGTQKEHIPEQASGMGGLVSTVRKRASCVLRAHRPDISDGGDEDVRLPMGLVFFPIIKIIFIM